jgi:hypothetical protein
MTEHDEAAHPRNHPTGKSRFSDKVQGAPESAVELAPSYVGDTRTGAQVIDDALRDRTVNFRHPVGIAETRRALRNSRGEDNGAVRQVALTWASVPPATIKDDFEVVGPKDGRPLVIHLASGLPRLQIKSGYVIVLANSHAGSALDVGAGATAVIIAGAGRKVSTTSDADAVVDYYAEEGARLPEHPRRCPVHVPRRPQQDPAVHRPGP